MNQLKDMMVDAAIEIDKQGMALGRIVRYTSRQIQFIQISNQLRQTLKTEINN